MKDCTAGKKSTVILLPSQLLLFFAGPGYVHAKNFAKIFISAQMYFEYKFLRKAVRETILFFLRANTETSRKYPTKFFI